MGVDYNKTLNLLQTEFPMRANLPTREPEFLEKWEKQDLYHSLMEKNAGKPKFILHDGPPYANGDMHIGHALDNILKDLVIRYKNMSGFCAPYIPGWDTHGLPIEQQAIKKLGLNRHEVDVLTFRAACRDFALGCVETQKGQRKRLGGIGDWENPYLTLHKEFESKQIEVFGEMANKGYIYKGLKPVYWCPDCETALAEAEIEYQDDPCDSIYVKFEAADDKGMFGGEKTYFVIWTTTTWTLPGNLAICLNPDFVYNIVKTGGERYIIAEELTKSVMENAGITDYEIVETHKGVQFEGMTAKHPFLQRNSHIILGDHVTLEAGTGCVHTAPGHGVDDFIVCRNYPEIGIVVPVDGKGKMTAEAGEKFAGLPTHVANKAILEELRSSGALFATEKIEHTYPHCWRCKHPIIFRATEQWFCSVGDFKEAACEEAHKVKWVPAWGEERIVKMIEDRSDWCISRQRVWGVPIPIFFCEKCGKEHITKESIAAVAALYKKEGSDAWYKYSAKEILPQGTVCEKCGADEFTKEQDIMDVWFDSGSSHAAVLMTREDQAWPADVYSEGNDQYRGWFQSSLLTSVAVYGKAPYKTVLTHGMVVDGNGGKMSKSLGNGIDPLDVIKNYGADILRLWVIASDYKVDIRFSNDILKQLSEAYRKIRNTARFILGNINDFDPNRDSVPYSELPEMDKYILHKLNGVIEKVRAAYEIFEYHNIFHTVLGFCVVDLSNFYLDVLKDRLYVEAAQSKGRRAAQTTMYTILDAITKLLAPALAYTAEEIWQFMPHKDADDKESILFNEMASVNPDYTLSPDTEAKWNRIMKIRDDVKKALEEARANKVIGASLDAKVTIFAQGDEYEFLSTAGIDLAENFIVSEVEIVNGTGEGVKGENSDITVLAQASEKEKCERCWKHTELGANKEHQTLCSRCAQVVVNA